MFQLGLFCGQEVGDDASLAFSMTSSGHSSSTFIVKETIRIDSPPMREDDKDGHYTFVVGENLTSRCNYTSQKILKCLLV